jgi:type IV pilus assembly protein PilC
MERLNQADKAIMPQYSYKAMDSDGKRVDGQIQANNADDLALRLSRMGLDLINYQARKSRLGFMRRVDRVEMITFCLYMEHLIHAGVPILEGLEDLRDSMRQSRLREVIASLIEDIEGGQRLSEAMAKFPQIFDHVFVNLVRVGEESGQLDRIFKHLSESLKWQDELVAQTKKLLMYPAFVGTVVSAAIIFVMVYLVPQIIQFLESMDYELPMHTKALIWVSEFLQNYWYAPLGGIALGVVGIWIAALLSQHVHFWLDGLKLKVWVIGPILKKIILARFANFFALMYASGITVLESIELTEKIVNNLVIERALREVRGQISEGASISNSFTQARLFPPLVLRMISIGEATGELDAALLNVSYFYNREVRESIDKIQAIIEPAMTLVFGVLLGWVMMSVLGPIYDLISNIPQ